MTPLYYPTALQQVQDALLDVVNLGLRERKPAVADLAALAALPTIGAGAGTQLAERELRMVTSEGVAFIWRGWSVAAGDGVDTVAPADRVAAARPGRWQRAGSTLLGPSGVSLAAQATGYLKNVALWAGEMTGKLWSQRILHARPAAILRFTGEDKEGASTLRGLVSQVRFRFEVWGVSLNLRPDLEAERGPALGAEAAADPGVVRLMGDLENLLDGLLGADLGLDGVSHCMVGAANPAIEDLGGREFIWTAPLEVIATVNRLQPANPPLQSLFVATTSDGATPDAPYNQVVPPA